MRVKERERDRKTERERHVKAIGARQVVMKRKSG